MCSFSMRNIFIFGQGMGETACAQKWPVMEVRVHLQHNFFFGRFVDKVLHFRCRGASAWKHNIRILLVPQAHK